MDGQNWPGARHRRRADRLCLLPDRRDRDGKFYATICHAEEKAVAPFLKTSPSEEMIARELQKTAIAVDTDAAKLLNAELKRDVIESVNYRLSSVNVKEISLA